MEKTPYYPIDDPRNQLYEINQALNRYIRAFDEYRQGRITLKELEEVKLIYRRTADTYKQITE